jgi:predicted Zn-dependent protease
MTCYPACAALAPADLLGMARVLRDRLQAEGREVEAWVERSVGRVDVGNTRGVIAGYDVSLAGLGVRVRAKTPSGPAQLRLHDAGSGAPDEAMLAALVDEVEWRLAPPLLEESPPEGESIWFGPRAVAALVVPLCQALMAGRVWSDEGPFAGMVGERILSPQLTLTDDPLAPGRPGTCPVDDEGVVCRPITLIREGVLCGALADLATATRLGIPASGHGRRSPGGPPWTGWSNLRMEPGTAGPNGRVLLNEGILVRDLPLPAAECYDGRIALATPWAYQVKGGEVVGRYERLLLKGNVFEWLNRVEQVGEGRWIGGRFLPNLVIARV